jgi:hypothetical protein
VGTRKLSLSLVWSCEERSGSDTMTSSFWRLGHFLCFVRLTNDVPQSENLESTVLHTKRLLHTKTRAELNKNISIIVIVMVFSNIKQ